eukprot:179199_1
MLRGKERGTNLCFTFQNKGNCARGTACKFDHTPPTESPCYDFIHGRCKREADCRYSHALAREQMAPRGRSQGKGKGGQPNTDRGDSSKESAKMKNLQTACFDFIHGRCSRYEACRYSHALAREQMRQRGQADGGDPTDGESRESILKHIADDKSKFMKNRKRSRDDDAQLAVRKRVRAPRRNRRRGGKNKDDKNVWITVLPPIHYQPSADQSRFGGGPGARQPRSFGMPMPMQSSQQPPNNVVRPPKFTGFKPAPEKSVPTPEDFASFFEDSVDMSDGDEPMFPETQAGSLQKRSCDLVERKANKMKSEFPQPKRILPSENMSQRPDTRPDTRPPFQRPSNVPTPDHRSNIPTPDPNRIPKSVRPTVPAPNSNTHKYGRPDSRHITTRQPLPNTRWTRRHTTRRQRPRTTNLATRRCRNTRRHRTTPLNHPNSRRIIKSIPNSRPSTPAHRPTRSPRSRCRPTSMRPRRGANRLVASRRRKASHMMDVRRHFNISHSTQAKQSPSNTHSMASHQWAQPPVAQSSPLTTTLKWRPSNAPLWSLTTRPLS